MMHTVSDKYRHCTQVYVTKILMQSITRLNELMYDQSTYICISYDIQYAQNVLLLESKYFRDIIIYRNMILNKSCIYLFLI